MDYFNAFWKKKKKTALIRSDFTYFLACMSRAGPFLLKLIREAVM